MLPRSFKNEIRLAVIATLIVTALAIILFGPRPNGSLPHDAVIIDYWEKWTGTEEAQMKQIVDDFNTTVGTQKHIFVRYVSTSNISQKTLVATAAGVPPDVAGLWDANLVQFAALDALEPLDDLAAAHHITPALYKPVFWKTCFYNSHLYALISTPGVIALHYNTALFKQNAAKLRAAGLDPARPPKTLDELDAYSAALTQFAPDGHLDHAGFLPLEPGWYLGQTHLWFGGQIWDEKNHRITLTTPEVVRAYTWVQSYSKRLGKNALAAFRSGQGNFDSPQNAFFTGTIAMEQQGPWMANFIRKNKPSMDDQWAAAPFPSAVPGMENVTYCTSDVLCIPRGARHKNEAFEFIAYVNTPSVMEKLCSLHCKSSPLANVSRDFMEHHPNHYIKVFEELSSSPNAFSVPQIPIMPEVGDELGNVIAQLAIVDPDADPKSLLAEAQQRLQQKYEHFMEIQSLRHAAPAAGDK